MAKNRLKTGENLKNIANSHIEHKALKEEGIFVFYAFYAANLIWQRFEPKNRLKMPIYVQKTTKNGQKWPKFDYWPHRSQRSQKRGDFCVLCVLPRHGGASAAILIWQRFDAEKSKNKVQNALKTGILTTKKHEFHEKWVFEPSKRVTTGSSRKCVLLGQISLRTASRLSGRSGPSLSGARMMPWVGTARRRRPSA